MMNRLLKSTCNKHETLHCQKRSGEHRRLGRLRRLKNERGQNWPDLAGYSWK